MRRLIIACLAVLLLFSISCTEKTEAPVPEPVASTPTKAVQPLPAQHLYGYVIPVNKTIALHGKSRDEIASLRQELISRHEDLNIFHNPYTPRQSVYGRMTGGDDWLKNTQFYVSNPYLLALTSSAYKASPLLPFCGVTAVSYSPGTITATYFGREAEQWFYYIYDYHNDSFTGQVRLWLVNALDAGYSYAHLDASRSENVDLAWPEAGDSLVRGIYSSQEYFHVGRYGKNNISPADVRARLRLIERDVRTVIHIKLWRERPPSAGAPEDLAYVIVIEP